VVKQRPDRRRASSGPLAVAAFLMAVFPACGGGSSTPSGGGQDKIGSTPITTPGGAAVATERAVDQATGKVPLTPEAAGPGGTAGPPEGIKHPPITDDDFLDVPEHRDPFQPFEAPKPSAVAQESPTPLPAMPLPEPEKVVFPDREIGDLACKMILAMRGEKPRAYLVGPDGEHAFVMQGEYVGRAIRTAANEPEVHWRVYEIEEGGVSFELSNASGQEGDTGVRPALRLYNTEEMKEFESLFSLR